MKTKTGGLVVACALLTTLLSSGASAQTTYDLITIERTSNDVLRPGEEITVEYETSAPDAEYEVEFIFGNSLYEAGEYVFANNGRGAQTIHEFAPAGLWTLQWISVSWYRSGEGDRSHSYMRDGTVHIWSGDEQYSQDHHDIDFEAIDFSVVNPNEDVTVPTLRAFSLPEREGLIPGDTVRIDYVADDEDSGLEFAWATYEGPDGRSYEVHEPYEADAPQGFMTIQVKNSWPDGHYRLKSVGLNDRRWLESVFERDGTVAKHPDLAHGPDEHDLDLSAGDFWVTNPDADLHGPTLSQVIEAERSFFPGEVAIFEYEADDSSGVGDATFMWRSNGDSIFRRDAWDAGSEADGKLEVPIDNWTSFGHYELAWVALEDVEGNETFFTDYGDLFENDVYIGQHTLDFSVADFEVVAWPHSFKNLASSQGAIDIDFESGKFRFRLTPWDEETVVRVGEVTELPGGVYRVRFDGDGVTLDGTFEPSTGVFQAKYSEGGITYTMVGANPKGPTLPAVPVLP